MTGISFSIASVNVPLPVVDVEVVALEEVVRDVDVGTPVAVEVGDDDAEPVGHVGAVNAGRRGHVGEMPAVVPIEPLARRTGPRSSRELRRLKLLAGFGELFTTNRSRSPSPS